MGLWCSAAREKDVQAHARRTQKRRARFGVRPALLLLLLLVVVLVASAWAARSRGLLARGGAEAEAAEVVRADAVKCNATDGRCMTTR